MYVGRFVVVAPDRAAYRVSSRSFPDRRVVERDGTLTVAPTPDAPETDNPYVSYNCVRIADGGTHAVVGNGSHVDPIVEKLELGYPPRDALVEPLLALDYEKDDYDTPRIAGVVSESDDADDADVADDAGAYVGIVRRDALVVHAVEEPTLVATYEKDRPEAVALEADEPTAMAREVYEYAFEHPVCSAAVARTGDGKGYEMGFFNGD